MPNVIFAAYRPVQAIVDADVWTRDDGAIRASTVLGEGSIYTVVSARPQVTAEQLRSDGSVDTAPEPVRAAGAGARTSTVPDSTTPETIALADRVGGRQATRPTTWSSPTRTGCRATCSTTSNAPVPAAGQDAVDDFLFDSQARLLRADRVGAGDHAAHAGRADPRRHRLRGRHARPRRRGLRGACQRRPRVGRGVVPRDGLAGVRSDGVGAARPASRRRSRSAASWRRACPDTSATTAASSVSSSLIGLVALAVVALAARAPPPPPPRPLGSAAGSLRIARRSPRCARRRDQRPPCRDLDSGRRCRGGAGRSPSSSTGSPSIRRSTTTTASTTRPAGSSRSCRGASSRQLAPVVREPRRYSRSDVPQAGSHVRSDDGRAGVGLRRDVHGARRFPRRVRHRGVLARRRRRGRVPRLVRVPDRVGADRRPRPRPHARALGTWRSTSSACSAWRSARSCRC